MVRQSVCRLCLATDSRTLVLAGGPLQEVYEKLTNTALHKGDRPIVACYLCHSQLRRTHDLMVKALRADNLLTEICLNSLELKRESIIGVNREAHKLNDIRTRFTIVPLVIMDPELIRKEQKIKDEPIAEDAASVHVDNKPLKEVQDIKLEVDIENIKNETIEDIEFEPSGGLEVDNEESEESDIKSETSMDIEDGELVPFEPSVINDSEHIEDFVPVKKCKPTQDTRVRPQLLQSNIHKRNKANVEVEGQNSGTGIHPIVEITDVAYIEHLSESTSSYSTADLNIIHTRNTMEAEFVCDVCGEKFSNDYMLKKHKQNHADNEHTKYKICQRSSHRNSNSLPFLNTDLGDICVLSNEVNLNDYLSTEIDDKSFKCIICQREFKHKSSLKKHLHAHTGVKPFICGICQRGFNRKDTLGVHLNIHTGKKPFKCDVCKRGFNHRWTLNNHLNTHTGDKRYICEICHHKFAQKTTLDNHLKIHTGKKPFKCEICQHRFIQKPNLEKHLKIHTGEKPFKCGICEYRFSLKGALNRHLKIHDRE